MSINIISPLDLRLEQIINRHEYPFATTNTRSSYCIRIVEYIFEFDRLCAMEFVC